MLGKALHAVEVVTFDYPCKFICILLKSRFTGYIWCFGLYMEFVISFV